MTIPARAETNDGSACGALRCEPSIRGCPAGDSAGPRLASGGEALRVLGVPPRDGVPGGVERLVAPEAGGGELGRAVEGAEATGAEVRVGGLGVRVGAPEVLPAAFPAFAEIVEGLLVVQLGRPCRSLRRQWHPGL
jgi:hypothetical protein